MMYQSLFLTLARGLLYIVCSTGLIAFNKYLMHADRYPYAIALVFGHMTSCFVMSFLLYLCCPSLYPALQGEPSEVKAKIAKGMKVLLPMSAFFAGTLVLSNQAYLYCSLAFLQMMKEGNLILVYVISLALRLETWNPATVQLLLFIMFATSLTIIGELRFAWIGFFIQLASQACETSKLCLQNLFLVGDGLRFDVLSFVLLISPLCSVLLAVKLYLIQYDALVAERCVLWLPALAANALLAFALNITIAMFIKYSSAVSLVVAGIIKDIVIVLCSAVVFREPVSLTQTVGFLMQLTGIFVYGLARTFPEDFQDGVVHGVQRVYFHHYNPPLCDKDRMSFPDHDAHDARVADYGTLCVDNKKGSV